MRWLAIDPGKTVGWATGWRERTGIHLHSFGQDTYATATDVLDDAIVGLRINAVVMEDFVVLDNRLREGSVITRKVVTSLTGWVRSQGLPLYRQQASAAKGVITDPRLKAMGLWVSGKHARDAVRHLVIATRREAAGGSSFQPYR